MREILLVLSGIEGQYIRAVENESSIKAANDFKFAGLSGSHITLTIDVDNADRSAANLVIIIVLSSYILKLLQFYDVYLPTTCIGHDAHAIM